MPGYAGFLAKQPSDGNAQVGNKLRFHHEKSPARIAGAAAQRLDSSSKTGPQRPKTNRPTLAGWPAVFEESLAILRSLSGFSAALDWIFQQDREVLLLLPINHHVFRSVVAERLHCVLFADAFLGTRHGHLLGARLLPGGDFDIGDTIELAERLTDVCFAAPSGDSGHCGNVLHLRVCRADIANQGGGEQAGDECDSGHGLLIWFVVATSREGQRTARIQFNVHRRPAVATPEMNPRKCFARPAAPRRQGRAHSYDPRSTRSL